MADQDNDSLIPTQREAQRVLERMAEGKVRREAVAASVGVPDCNTPAIERTAP